MRRRNGIYLAVLGGVVASAIVLTLGRGERDAWSLVESTCVDCHNDIDFAGSMSLAGMTPESIAEHPEIFEAVVHRLRGRFMPPPGAEQPALAELDALIREIETRLDADLKRLEVGCGAGAGGQRFEELLPEEVCGGVNRVSFHWSGI